MSCVVVCRGEKRENSRGEGGGCLQICYSPRGTSFHLSVCSVTFRPIQVENGHLLGRGQERDALSPPPSRSGNLHITRRKALMDVYKVLRKKLRVTSLLLTVMKKYLIAEMYLVCGELNDGIQLFLPSFLHNGCGEKRHAAGIIRREFVNRTCASRIGVHRL